MCVCVYERLEKRQVTICVRDENMMSEKTWLQKQEEEKEQEKARGSLVGVERIG